MRQRRVRAFAYESPCSHVGMLEHLLFGQERATGHAPLGEPSGPLLARGARDNLGDLVSQLAITWPLDLVDVIALCPVVCEICPAHRSPEVSPEPLLGSHELYERAVGRSVNALHGRVRSGQPGDRLSGEHGIEVQAVSLNAGIPAGYVKPCTLAARPCAQQCREHGNRPVDGPNSTPYDTSVVSR